MSRAGYSFPKLHLFATADHEAREFVFESYRVMLDSLEFSGLNYEIEGNQIFHDKRYVGNFSYVSLMPVPVRTHIDLDNIGRRNVLGKV